MSEDKAEPKVLILPSVYSSPELDRIFELAYPFDGYESYFEELGKLANGVARKWHLDGGLPHDLKLLRGSLFYEARRARFVEGYPGETDMPYLRALATEIEKGITAPTSE